MPKRPDDNFFDSEQYLRDNPDVADAVRAGAWPSAFMHYCVAGRRDGRQADPPVDEHWYENTYASVARECADGLAATPRDHYLKIGAFRGYRSHEGAELNDGRGPDSPSARDLWLDAGDAEDVIAARLEQGRLSDAEAATARIWHRRGWLLTRTAPILEDAEYECSIPLPGRALHAARLVLDEVPAVKARADADHTTNAAWVQASALFAFSARCRFLVAVEADGAVVEIASSGHRLAKPRHLGRWSSLAELVLFGRSHAAPRCLEEYRQRLDAQILSWDLAHDRVSLGAGDRLLLHADAPFRVAEPGPSLRLSLVSGLHNHLEADALHELPSWAGGGRC